MDDALPLPGTDATKYLQDCADFDSVVRPGEFEFAKAVIPDGGKNLFGVGFSRSNLHYRGYEREDGCIQLPAGAWGSLISGFALKNLSATRMGTGIRSGNTNLLPQFGTQSGTSNYKSLLIDGFEYGMRFGSTEFNSSSSEVTLDIVKVNNCTYGVVIETQNSLNYKIDQFGASDCYIALVTDKAGCVHLRVGSFSNVDTVWQLVGAGVYSATGLRTEGCGHLLEVGNTLATTDVTLNSCMTNGNRRQDKVDVKVSGGVNLRVNGGLYDGMFLYEGFKQDEPGQGTLIFDGVRTRHPILIQGTPGTKCRYECRDCAIVNSDNEVIQRVDQKGILGDDVVVPAQHGGQP
jgi:hypothetical protein